MAARRRSGGSSGRGARARKPPTVLYSPEFAAAVATVRSQVAKYRTAAALLDAYELDGWRGASREKLRPEAELAAARRRVLEAKLRIRDCLRVLDEAGGHVSIPEAAFDADGEVDEADVFCAACREHESTDDNDIVLCDGDCRRAYHLGCLNPPITLDDLPPGDEGWLCPACDAKLDAVWMVNSAFGTEHASDVLWSDVFAAEAARAAAAPAATALGGLGGDEAEWPSDEEDDEDFDPSAAAARLASPRGAGGDADDESGSDGDDEEGEEDEEESDSDEDADAAAAPRRRTRALAAAGDSDSDVDADAVLAADAAADGSDTSSESESEPAPILGKRRRPVVDYAALNEEMFGGGGGSDGGGSMSLLSDDDDWRSGGPASPRSAGGGSGFASPRSGAGGSGFASPRSAGGGGITGRGRNGFGPAVASALEAAFARDALPKAAAKEALAARTGLTVAQVNTWFNNRRQRVKREGAAAAAGATPASRRRSDTAGDAAPEAAAAPAAAASGGARGAAAQPPAAKKAKTAKPAAAAAGASPAPPQQQQHRTAAASPAAAAGASPGVASPPGGRFPPAVVARLEALYASSDGAPTEKQRVALVAATGLTRLQVRTWFTNQRSRRNAPGRR